MTLVRRFTDSRHLRRALRQLDLPPTTFGHLVICIEVRVEEATVVLIEATPKSGVRRLTVPWALATDGRYLWSRFDIPSVATLVEQADRQIGRPYDWPAIWKWLPRHKISGWLGRSLRRDHPDQRCMCSELWLWLARDFGGLDLFPRFAPDTKSPNDVAYAICQHLLGELDDRGRKIDD